MVTWDLGQGQGLGKAMVLSEWKPVLRDSMCKSKAQTLLRLGICRPNHLGQYAVK